MNIEVRNICVSLSGQDVLRDLSISFSHGQITALIGPSGCGKSTFLRLFVGLVQPDRGSILLADRPLTVESILSLRRRIGYVIQEGGLFPHLTARRNIALLARRLGKPPEWIHARVESLRELTQYPSDRLDRYPGQLSGGQRQRVALMRALVLDPDLLLLDEPLAALDPMIRSSLQLEMRAMLRSLGKTTLLVTHDMAEAAFFTSDVVLLRNGEVVQRGSLDDLIHRPATSFVREFLASQRVLATGEPTS